MHVGLGNGLDDIISLFIKKNREAGVIYAWAAGVAKLNNFGEMSARGHVEGGDGGREHVGQTCLFRILFRFLQRLRGYVNGRLK